jgi:nucleotide-binding universal stress UspA family protein
MFAKILVAVGGNDASIEPARIAGRLASVMPASVTIVSVARAAPSSLGEPYLSRFENKEMSATQALLEEARLAAITEGAAQVDTERIEGPAAERIVEFADHNDFTMIVLGNRHRGRLRSAILGSVSAGVASHSHVPVVIAPEPNGAHEGA